MKRQYKWITVLSALLLVVSITAGIYNWVYCNSHLSQVDSIGSLFTKEPNEYSAELADEAFREPVEDLTNLLLTNYIGEKLVNNILYSTYYKDAVAIDFESYQAEFEKLSNYEWDYFVTNTESPSLGSDDAFMTKGNYKNITRFLNNAPFESIFFFRNNNGKITAEMEGEVLSGKYDVSSAYSKFMGSIDEILEGVHYYFEESSILYGMDADFDFEREVESLFQALGYIDNPESIHIAFVLYDFNMPAFSEAYNEYINNYNAVRNLYLKFNYTLISLAVAVALLITMVLNFTGLLRKLFSFTARIFRQIPVECVIAVWLAVIIASTAVYNNYCYYWSVIEIFRIVVIACLAFINILFAGITLSFLYYNRAELKKNCISSKVKVNYRIFTLSLPFVKRLYVRIGIYVLISAVSICVFLLGVWNNALFLWISGFLAAAASLLLFGAKMREISRDLDITAKKIANISDGNMDNRLSVASNSDLKQMIDILDSLQDTVETEVQERMKSERMKVELVTNVSHDLKTPLTSIINYIKLLEDEDLMPTEANDYVKVLRNKINRLNNLTVDLFDVAKASSGEMELVLEIIELSELVGQTMAENQEEIDDCNLQFRVTVSKKVYIKADGQKIYRAVENVIINAIKYSMFGTRVYIDIFEEDGIANILVKNISNYEMKFDPEDITNRFVRGDDSRSTEGSGLGLSIARSFVELMCGSLSIEVDGDLFKAIIKFPSVEKEQSLEHFHDN